MPTILQLRRGTTTEHASFTGAEGEVTVNTTKDTLVVHDGSTAGGFEIALADGSNVSVSTEQVQDAAATMFTTATHTNITATYDDAAGTLSLAAAEGYGDSDARGAISVSGDLAYNSGTGVISYTEPTMYADADARAAVSASGDLSYNSSTGVFSYTEPTMYADADARGAISVSGDLSYNSGTGVIRYTEPTMYADADARGAISVTDSGGDGSLSYNSGTGAITYTGPSATEVRAHFTGGTGIDITSGSIAVDSTIATKTYADSAASTAVAAVIDSSPAALDTLNELAAALGDDANFSTTVTNSIGTKLNSSAVSAFGLTLVDDADAATARTTLGLGTAATTASTAYATAAQGSTADSAVQNLGDLGISSTAAEINKLDGFTGVVADLNYAKDLRATGVTSTEFDYLDGVTSNIQTQLNAKQATITGAATTIDTENLTVSRALVSDGSGKVAVSAVTSTEIGYLDGVTSAIQTQLNAKQATITGAATTIDTENLTASRALVSDGSGKVGVSAVTSTELGYLDGVTSAIQTQLNAKGVGDITGVTAGSGLTGGGASGSVTLNVGAGSYITVAADTVAVDATSAATVSKVVARDASGDFSANIITAVDFNATSDQTMKTNVTTIESSLEKLDAIRGVNFNWKKDARYAMGVIAQEVEEVIPEVVSIDGEGLRSVNYGALVGLLIEAVKDLKNEIEELKAHK